MAAAIFVAAKPASAAWGEEYFTNTEFVTQDGKKVKLWNDLMKDKQVIINFIYTTCGDSCPLETARLAQVQKILGDHMGKEIYFLSFSIDPVRDTPAELKLYAKKFHAGPGWFFLTGKKSDVEMVRKKIGLAAHADENQLTQHSTSFMIGNPRTGQWFRDSSTDNPAYVATVVRDWLGDWSKVPKGASYENRPNLPDSVHDKGAYLFSSRCAPCHTIGKGDALGPDLLGVTVRRDKTWLTSFIMEPGAMVAKKDPTAMALFNEYNKLQMPNLRLNDVDMTNMLRFLTAQDAAHGKTRPPAGAPRAKATAGL